MPLKTWVCKYFDTCRTNCHEMQFLVGWVERDFTRTSQCPETLEPTKKISILANSIVKPNARIEKLGFADFL